MVGFMSLLLDQIEVDLLFRGLGFDPRSPLGVDKLLDPVSAGQAQPQGTRFGFGSQVDLKEWAADTFPGRPFRDELIGLHIGWKLELKPVRQFANSGLQGTQGWAEFVEVTLSLLWRECQPVARQWTLLFRLR